MEIAGIEDKQKRPRQKSFSLSGVACFYDTGLPGPILTLLSRFLQHAFHVKVLLLYVSLLGPSNTWAKNNLITAQRKR
jgi:hypothetical protein